MGAEREFADAMTVKPVSSLEAVFMLMRRKQALTKLHLRLYFTPDRMKNRTDQRSYLSNLIKQCAAVAHKQTQLPEQEFMHGQFLT